MKVSWHKEIPLIFRESIFFAIVVSVVCYANHNMDTSLLFKENDQKASVVFLKGPACTLCLIHIDS